MLLYATCIHQHLDGVDHHGGRGETVWVVLELQDVASYLCMCKSAVCMVEFSWNLVEVEILR